MSDEHTTSHRSTKVNGRSARDEAGAAERHPGARLRYDLIPPGPLAAVAYAFTIGAPKRPHSDWRDGYQIDPSEYVAKIFRHLQAYRRGEQYDPDDGHEHLAAVVADCLVLMEYEQFGPVPCKDDRVVRRRPVMLNEHLSIKACKALAGRARKQGLRRFVKEWWCVNEGVVDKNPFMDIRGSTIECPAFTVLEAMALLRRMGSAIAIGPGDCLSGGAVEWFWQDNHGEWWGPFGTPAAAVEGALQYLEIMEASDE
jgi:hypothetical protein